MLKGNAASRAITYVDVTVVNPALLLSEARAPLSVLYMVLTVGFVSTLSPDFKGAVPLVTELQENVHRKPNQIRVAPWLYGASAGPMLVFTAERK